MRNFLDFIKESPTMFHAAKNIEKLLINNNFIKLNEGQKWNLVPNGKYYLTRNSSSVLAFTLPADLSEISFNITAAHLDSPTFKLKPNFKIEQGRYNKLNTEIYGGPILNTWLDRPLNIAGRVIIKENNSLITKLISFDKPMAIIPNCSIHYYHELNTGVKLNPQSDLLPILCDNNIGNTDLYELIAEKLCINKENIVSSDLYLALLDRGNLVGPNEEFICAPQIDNLECAYATIQALIDSKNDKSVNVCVEFDNEEIGSRTRQGAQSLFLSDVLERISFSLGKNTEEHKIYLSNSFIVSADNAQGFHPNYPQKYDPTNACYINSGIVIKNAARGSYTTDAFSLAYFKTICELAGAKYQLNTNRSDVPGGSTLGAISLSQVSIPSVDIGLPQIAMHSAYETAGSKDLDDILKALTKFYELHITSKEDGEISY